MNSIGIESKNVEEGTVKNILKDVLFKSYGSNQLISKIMNSQIYLNNKTINNAKRTPKKNLGFFLIKSKTLLIMFKIPDNTIMH